MMEKQPLINEQTNVRGGHFLAEDLSYFDAPFFNLTRDEAAVGSQSVESL